MILFKLFLLLFAFGAQAFECEPVEFRLITYEPAIVMTDATIMENHLGRTVVDFNIFVDEGDCPGSVAFNVGYSSVKIHVHDKFRRGSCEFYAIVDHEAKHVEAYSRVLRRYAQLFEEELVILQYRLNRNIAEIRREIEKSQNISNIHNLMKAELERENAAIDTPAESQRVRALCRNW
ncbi:MAG: hypothetical protein FWD15_00670 [Alphaproteobacteria bacterium]|nr:hypothetical protein [Alphaproteobacteria bacterium]